MDKQAPKMEVKCSVDNCQYNQSRKCYAQGLEVNAMGDTVAETSDGTCCKTFINQKNQGHSF